MSKLYRTYSILIGREICWQQVPTYNCWSQLIGKVTRHLEECKNSVAMDCQAVDTPLFETTVPLPSAERNLLSSLFASLPCLLASLFESSAPLPSWSTHPPSGPPSPQVHSVFSHVCPQGRHVTSQCHHTFRQCQLIVSSISTEIDGKYCSIAR